MNSFVRPELNPRHVSCPAAIKDFCFRKRSSPVLIPLEKTSHINKSGASTASTPPWAHFHSDTAGRQSADNASGFLVLQ